MTFQSLSWRIGLPFAGFVLAGSVALVLLMSWQFAGERRARLEQMAVKNALFVLGSGLPASERAAGDLQKVLGLRVLFRQGKLFTTEEAEKQSVPEFEAIPADGELHHCGNLDVIAVPIGNGHDLVLVDASMPWRELWRGQTFAVLGAFWLLAIVVAWLVAKGLVRPLRNLAARLPEIERAGPLELPEAGRRDEIGEVALAFLRTRAALQQAREENERKEKLAVLGRMTAALAHEIQNPVAAIKMHAQLWQQDGGNSTADVIEREAERIEGLLNQWLFLSRPEPPGMSEVDVALLLEQVVKAHQAQLDHAQVQVRLQPGSGVHVQGDARRLSQVFRNLLVNAVQAMPRGGLVEVTVTAQGGETRISFADSGRGFSEQALQRFSEFFFSEKEGGMGIGLSVASEIVKAHHGSLRAENRPAGGACVTVSLPASHRNGSHPETRSS